MTSPVKRGNSSETLGRNSNTVRTTEPASITHYLWSETDKDMSPFPIRTELYRFNGILGPDIFAQFSLKSKDQMRASESYVKRNGKEDAVFKTSSQEHTSLSYFHRSKQELMIYGSYFIAVHCSLIKHLTHSQKAVVSIILNFFPLRFVSSLESFILTCLMHPKI